MSLTGALYKVSEQELENILESEKNNLEHLQDSIDLSYFATDYLEIIATYSGLDRNDVGEILQGTTSIEVDDGYFGYSKRAEIRDIKSKTLDRISENDFVNYLNRAEQEGHLLGPYYSSKDVNRGFFVEYFNDIKRIYEEAVTEGKCLVYRIG